MAGALLPREYAERLAAPFYMRRQRVKTRPAMREISGTVEHVNERRGAVREKKHSPHWFLTKSKKTPSQEMCMHLNGVLDVYLQYLHCE